VQSSPAQGSSYTNEAGSSSFSDPYLEPYQSEQASDLYTPSAVPFADQYGVPLGGHPEGLDDIVSGLSQVALASPSPSSGQQAEQLDSRYTVRDQPSRYFQIGKIFKTLWTEPAGGTATDLDKGYYRSVGFGQRSFTKIRRFIVIRKRLHSSLCLPISTYGGQGAAKRDVRAEDHAIVYPTDDPEPDSDENLSKEPFGIIIEEPGETIDPKSRIDFGKVYTVEHNLKVMNVGRIHSADKNRLLRYFNESMGMLEISEDAYDSEPRNEPRKPDKGKSSRHKRRGM